MIEVLCETDFVAKNEKFYDYVKEAAARVLAGTSGEGDVTAKAQEIENEKLGELFVKFGEKMVLRRALRFEAPAVATYMHGEGRIGIMIEAEGSDDAALLKDVCMHIAAFSPEYIVPEDIPADRINKEKEIAAAQLQGKPANMIEKDPWRQIEQVVLRGLPYASALDPRRQDLPREACSEAGCQEVRPLDRRSGSLIRFPESHFQARIRPGFFIFKLVN